jgi:hypothetical protein
MHGTQDDVNRQTIHNTNGLGLQAQQFVVGSLIARTNTCVPAFQFSVLTNYKKLLTKTVYPDNRAQPCYAMKFKYTYHEAHTLEEFAWDLGWLSNEQHRCIIRGRLKAEFDLDDWHRRLIKASYNKYTDKIDEPTIECGQRRWIVIDADGCRVPAGLGAPDKLAEAGYGIRDHVLPSLFRGVRCVVAATTKTGLVGPDIAHLRMFFMLAEASENDLLRVWLEKLNLEYPFIDPSVGDPEHIIYTARPTFIGRDDPVPEWGRVRLLDGYEETIAPELPKERVRKKQSGGSCVPVPMVVDFSGVSPELLELWEQDAGEGVHPIEETSEKAWLAIKRIFEMLDGCPKAGCEDTKGGSRHYTLTAVAWELVHLVAECELTEELARKAYWEAASGINNSDRKYSAADIQRRLDDAFADVIGAAARRQ